MFRVVEKKRAYEDIVRQVIALIKDGKLKRGDQLPSERDLTKIFKVSRTTVREAIRTLESMKLLQCCQGIGNYVFTSSENDEIQPLAAAHFMRKKAFTTSSISKKLSIPIAQLTQ
jgi:GntR family transcriptional repressor for pyruvate dehydrogenase complex